MKNLLRKLHLIPDPRAGQENRRVEKAQRNATVPNARRSYADHLAKNDPETAMSLAVGGDYEVMGEALRERLTRFGLRSDHYLIDVGCGSGRVAFAFARSDFRHTLRSLGPAAAPGVSNW